MRYSEITEAAGSNRPLVVVDVQPGYKEYIPFTPNLMRYVNSHRGPVLMLVNAEETGVSDDTKEGIAEYWIENGLRRNKLDRMQILDKGYGHFRSWMDYLPNRDVIVRIGKFMIQHNVSDSRDIEEKTGQSLYQVMGDDYQENCEDDPLYIGWIEAQALARFPNPLICGGGKNECLAEVLLLLQMLDMPYEVLPQFVYG